MTIVWGTSVAAGDDYESADRAYHELMRQTRDIEDGLRHFDDEGLASLGQRIQYDLAEHAEPARTLWSGVASYIEAELRMRGRWASELGTWFAVATRFTTERPASRFANGATIEYVECRGRANAEKAARALRREYIDDFSVTDWVALDIYPDGGWVVPEGGEIPAND